jgi:membrane-associated protease RseP (regulator of RpoE activity)
VSLKSLFKRESVKAASLFVLTFVSVLFTYAYMWVEGEPLATDSLSESAAFAVALMSTLLAHEFAHYFVAKRHGFSTSLPLFIPFPMAFGTLGAIIRLDSEPESRGALLEMGASGPIAGFVVAVGCLFIGLPSTEAISIESASEVFAGAEVVTVFANPFVMDLVGQVTIGGGPGILDRLSPVALAGWVGCFLTAINMLPIGQLDGGHIMSAVSPRFAPTISKVTLLLMVAVGWYFWLGWTVWGAIIYFTGASEGLAIERSTVLNRRNWLCLIAALVSFSLSFMPSPITDLDLSESAPEIGAN